MIRRSDGRNGTWRSTKSRSVPFTTRRPTAPHWYRNPCEGDRAAIRVKLQAGFVDGHVETYGPGETPILEVADALDGTTPAHRDFGLGAEQFYIPRRALASPP
ncbi:MAG: hypothetical protein JW741_12925 [Sedimentisphaerales bacterium]|nr:hypothetical protein [Sedimentisphaerales bacterium]